MQIKELVEGVGLEPASTRYERVALTFMLPFRIWERDVIHDGRWAGTINAAPEVKLPLPNTVQCGELGGDGPPGV